MATSLKFLSAAHLLPRALGHIRGLKHVQEDVKLHARVGARSSINNEFGIRYQTL